MAWMRNFIRAAVMDFDKRVEKSFPLRRSEGVLEPQWHNEVFAHRCGVRRGHGGAGKGALQSRNRRLDDPGGWTWALQVDNCRYDFSLVVKEGGDRLYCARLQYGSDS